MTRRFAQDTSVPVSTTQAEIKAQLRVAGADGIAMFEASNRAAVGFQHGAAMYRLTVPVDYQAENMAQEERRAWRLLGLLVKAKVQAIREGATTVEREFLADMLLHDGQTVSERLGPELRLAYEAGRMPRALMLEGPKL